MGEAKGGSNDLAGSPEGVGEHLGGDVLGNAVFIVGVEGSFRGSTVGSEVNDLAFGGLGRAKGGVIGPSVIDRLLFSAILL